METYKTKKHTRTYHFTNGESLVISNIEMIRLEEDMIEVSHKDVRTVIYREHLNYFITNERNSGA